MEIEALLCVSACDVRNEIATPNPSSLILSSRPALRYRRFFLLYTVDSKKDRWDKEGRMDSNKRVRKFQEG